MVDGQFSFRMPNADIQKADPGSQLESEGPGVTLGQRAAVQGHGVVCAGHRHI